MKGRKRQVMVDTDGRGLILEPQPADIQDRDGAPWVLRLSRRSFPFIAKAFADSGYAGERPASATCIAIEIVRKPPDQGAACRLTGRGPARSAPVRKPHAPTFMRRSNSVRIVVRSSWPARGNTNSLTRTSCKAVTILSAATDRGTRCSRWVFMRAAGSDACREVDPRWDIA